jgi:hypothetical protein
MATKRTGTAGSTKIGNLDAAAIDSYITYVKALIKVVCRSDMRWTISRGIRVAKGVCPPPSGDGSTDLCVALKSLLKILLRLQAGLARTAEHKAR